MEFLKPLYTLISLFLITVSLTSQADEHCNNLDREVRVGDKCTVIETYKSEQLSNRPTLAITLHGDSPFWKPSVQYRVAQYIANNQDNVVSVGMLRPGYTDDFDRVSDGVRGETVGDNYDDERVNQIALAIKTLKQQYRATKVVLVGHSGGAAITARVMALFPELVNHAVVISCPCDINAWRQDMLKRNNYELFKGDLSISSPVALADKVSNSSQIDLIVGESDEVTKPYLTEKFYASLKSNGKKVNLQIIQGDHNIFQAQPVLGTILKALD